MPKRYSPRLKFQVVMEVISNKKDPSQIARSYDVHPNTIRNWVERFRENESEIFSKDGEVQERVHYWNRERRHSSLDYRTPLNYIRRECPMKRRNPELEMMIKLEIISDVHKKTSQSGTTFGYNLRRNIKNLL